MPKTRAMQQGRADYTSDGSGEEDIASARRADEPRRKTAPVTEQSETIKIMATMLEAFAKSQADANRRLIESLRPTWFPSAPTPTQATITPAAGNFSTCTARFDGKSREPDVVEAFIDAVEVYKECADVSDEHALRGLPMLLEGEAAVWWRGARPTVRSWSDALARLRAMYGARQPAHKVWQSIFAAEQSPSERAESLIVKVRSKLVKLPYNLSECAQIDIIYGLLNKRIRQKVSRDAVSSVDDLIQRARDSEDELTDINIDIVVNNVECYDRRERIEQFECDTATTGPQLAMNSKRSRVRCSQCKYFGHHISECRNRSYNSNNNVNSNKTEYNVTPSSDSVRCYGCGQLGVVRANCQNCRNNATRPIDLNFFEAHNVAKARDEEGVKQSPYQRLVLDHPTQPIVPVMDSARHRSKVSETKKILVSPPCRYPSNQNKMTPTRRHADEREPSELIKTGRYCRGAVRQQGEGQGRPIGRYIPFKNKTSYYSRGQVAKFKSYRNTDGSCEMSSETTCEVDCPHVSQLTTKRPWRNRGRPRRDMEVCSI